LTAGEINAKPHEHPQVHAKMKELSEALGSIWEENEAKYDKYIMNNPCPFLVDKSCSIYEIRPDGCRLFPNTAFGMLTQDCEPLYRFKKMRSVLKKGRRTKEKYYFAGKTVGSTRDKGPVKPASFSNKQYFACVAKLRKAGITEDEYTLFNFFNGKRTNPA
jgi:Fe-S-cluster containining protein